MSLVDPAPINKNNSLVKISMESNSCETDFLKVKKEKSEEEVDP